MSIKELRVRLWVWWIRRVKDRNRKMTVIWVDVGSFKEAPE